MYFRRRAREYRDRFQRQRPGHADHCTGCADPSGDYCVTQPVGAAAGAASGSACLSLSSPRITGNNQSLLSAQADPNDLHLELAPDPIVINQGQPLDMEVRFINEGIAPATLYLTGEPGHVSAIPNRKPGCCFRSRREAGHLANRPNVRPPYPIPQQFQANQLHVLGPRQRCSIRVEIARGGAQCGADVPGPVSNHGGLS